MDLDISELHAEWIAIIRNAFFFNWSLNVAIVGFLGLKGLFFRQFLESDSNYPPKTPSHSKEET